MVGDEGEKSFEDLLRNYYGGTHPILWPGVEGSNADTIFITSSFTFLRSGYYMWDYGGLGHRAEYGHYRSIRASSTPRPLYLGFGPKWLYYQDANPNGNGFSLCCVAKLKSQNIQVIFIT